MKGYEKFELANKQSKNVIAYTDLMPIFRDALNIDKSLLYATGVDFIILQNSNHCITLKRGTGSTFHHIRGRFSLKKNVGAAMLIGCVDQTAISLYILWIYGHIKSELPIGRASAGLRRKRILINNNLFRFGQIKGRCFS